MPDNFLLKKTLYKYKKDNINEIPKELRKNILNELISSSKDLTEISDEMKEIFPFLPKTADEYGITLSKFIDSVGIIVPVHPVKDFDKKQII